MLDLETAWGVGRGIYHWKGLKIIFSTVKFIHVHKELQNNSVRYFVCKWIYLQAFFICSLPFCPNLGLFQPLRESGVMRADCVIGLPLMSCWEFFVDWPALLLAKARRHRLTTQDENRGDI